MFNYCNLLTHFDDRKRSIPNYGTKFKYKDNYLVNNSGRVRKNNWNLLIKWLTNMNGLNTIRAYISKLPRWSPGLITTGENIQTSNME